MTDAAWSKPWEPRPESSLARPVSLSALILVPVEELEDTLRVAGFLRLSEECWGGSRPSTVCLSDFPLPPSGTGMAGERFGAVGGGQGTVEESGIRGVEENVDTASAVVERKEIHTESLQAAGSFHTAEPPARRGWIYASTPGACEAIQANVYWPDAPPTLCLPILSPADLLRFKRDSLLGRTKPYVRRQHLPPPCCSRHRTYTFPETRTAKLYATLQRLAKGYQASFWGANTMARRIALRREFEKRVATEVAHFERDVEGSLWSGMGVRIVCDLTFRATPTNQRNTACSNMFVYSVFTCRRALVHELSSRFAARAAAERAIARERLEWGASMLTQFAHLAEKVDKAELFFSERLVELHGFKLIGTAEEFWKDCEAFMGEMEELDYVGKVLALELERLGEEIDEGEEEREGVVGGGEGNDRAWWKDAYVKERRNRRSKRGRGGVVE